MSGHDDLARWEALMDQALQFAVEQRVTDALRELDRLRRWQTRRRSDYHVNSDWHHSEILWLRGVLLERTGQERRAHDTWGQLARRLPKTAWWRESYFLGQCASCAKRQLPFAPTWANVARALRGVGRDKVSVVAALRRLALDESGQPPAAVMPAVIDARRPSDEMGASKRSATSPKLRAARADISETFRDLEQPATVVVLAEDYLRQDPTDGTVWAWYGSSLCELRRYAEAATALQTARGLAVTDQLRSFVLQCQGDLALEQGRHHEAEERFREAVTCDDTNEMAGIKLGRVLFRAGDLDGAERCFRTAESAHGSFVLSALAGLAEVLRARSALFEARQVLKRGLKIANEAWLREMLADVERAIRVQTRAGKKTS